jgi:hypothetical protein
MPDLRLPLTDKNVLGLPFAATGQYKARDLDLGGFYLLVGKRTKSFVVAGDLRAEGLRQKTVRMKIGEAGEITCRDARARARTVLGELADGVDPRDPLGEDAESSTPETSGPTLREAWERYRVSHLLRKKRSPATIAGYQDHIDRLFGDWTDKPLADLGADPKAIADRHEAISEANGPTIANLAMRTFRAVYNHACKTAPTLPARNPVFAVDWNPEARRDTALGAADLVAWFEQLVRIENPIRREFHLLTLLSGSRPEALKTGQPDHLSFARRTMHFPKPKGGERRAFDIPLSRQMTRSLVRLIRMGRLLYPDASQEWLFPSDAQCGHIAEHKENRESKLTHYGNDLRQTFRTLAKAAGVPDLDAKLLMNHAMSGDVNAGYITRSKLMGDYLRSQQQTISDFVFAQLRQRKAALSPELLRWLEWSSRRQVSTMLEQDPDEVRARSANRSVVRKLHLQNHRCEAQDLSLQTFGPPSRRRRTAA